MVADLKQFILATVIQHTSGLVTKEDLKNGVDGLEDRLDQIRVGLERVKDAMFDSVIPFIDSANDKFDDHDKRIKRLEHRIA